MQSCSNDSKINNPCPTYPDAKCVVYSGVNLPAINTKTNDRLDVILSHINTAISGASSSIIFSTGLTKIGSTVTADISTGKAGGQTAYGGTLAGQDLTLSSTHHITKGNIYFGNSTYDEANNRLGISTLNPSRHISIEEKLWIYVTTTEGRIQVPNGQSLNLMANQPNAAPIFIRPYDVGGYVLFGDDLVNNGSTYQAFFNNGNGEGGRIGLHAQLPEREFFIATSAASSILALYGETRFNSYPSSRNDGSTSIAFYPDGTGKLRVGPISGGGGGGTVVKSLRNGSGATLTFTIAHGIVGTPNVLLAAGSQDASGFDYYTVDATNINIFYSIAPPLGASNLIFYWQANL